MKKEILFGILFLTSSVFCQNWKPKDVKLITEWGEKVSPENSHLEYPRPQFVRKDWMNLNGLWNYKIQTKFLPMPDEFSAKILVPFPIESSLSGVAERVSKENWLWYQRNFTVPKEWKGKRVILHFGAVDWESEIFVNGNSVLVHRGGYDEFFTDITNFTNDSKENILTVRVWDPTNDGFQPRGKQVNKPGGIWYTPVTGIWQTVWLEPVNDSRILSIKNISNIDKSELRMEINSAQLSADDCYLISVFDGNKEIASENFKSNEPITIKIPFQKLWSPDSPFLYNLKIKLIRKNKILDEADSYFAMRKISVEKDQHNISKIYLNNNFLFQFGTLDQGWWPDGLYTPPSDEALAFDIIKLKEVGFNTIRKHVKVEPARFYYHCDRLGMLVWQDMPSGDASAGRGENNEIQRNGISEYQFESELKALIDNRFNFPSIVIWVPFNEGWGQYNTIKICNWIAHYDPSRLVDGPSGWSDWFGAGNIQDAHEYPGPSMPISKNDNRALVLGEFGGLGLPLEGHTLKPKDNWGYVNYKNVEELENAFINLIKQIPVLINKGLSGAIYTQTTDVEVEVNGLMTYDRKAVKIGSQKVKEEILKLYIQ